VVRAPSGRQRFNVLGALNAITHQLLMVTNESSITATSVCELLEKIALLGLQTPVTVVMDNARYRRCRLVLEVATRLGIEMLFLPPYSPNLNLIERLWRCVRKECLYAKYYEHFEPFKQALTKCLSEKRRSPSRMQASRIESQEVRGGMGTQEIVGIEPLFGEELAGRGKACGNRRE
jgi:transposase